MALLQELKTAIGFKQQVDLVTPLGAADMWSLRQTSRNVPQPSLVTENDRDDLGKGIWATQVFPTNWDVQFPWECYLSSQNAAQIIGFALGKSVSVAAGTGTKYTFTPWDQAVDCLHDMPATTFLSQMFSCSNEVIDMAMVGVACEDFTVRLSSGVGRDNATISSNWVGTGDFERPSGIVIPAFSPEALLNAGGATIITINGVPYITNRRFVSAEFGYKNNILLDQGFYPGSGSKNGASIRGRLRRGVPECTLSFVAEFEHDSTELDAFITLDEGAAEIKVEGPVIGAGPEKHYMHAKWPRVMFSAAVIGENDNTLTIQMTCQVLQDATGKVFEVDVVTDKAGIMTAAVMAELKAA